MSPAANPQEVESPEVRSVLDPLPVDNTVKAEAWRVYHTASSPQQFQSSFDKLQLPKEAKAALWNAKFGGKKKLDLSQPVARPKGSGGTPMTPKEALGAGFGFLPVAGSIVGGATGNVPGAALGGASGEAANQLLRRLIGLPSPKTSAESATKIGTEGAISGVTEGFGRLTSNLLGPIEKYFSRTAARSTRIPFLPSEAGVGKGTSKVVEGFLSHAIPSRGIMEDFRVGQISKASEVFNGEIQRISKFNGTPEQVGMLTQNAMEDARTALKAETRSAYKAIDQLTESHVKRVPVTKEVTSSLVDESGRPMSYDKKFLEKRMVGGVQPETREVKKTAIMLLRELKMQEKLMDPKLLADTKSILETIVRADNNVPYQTMAKSRSDLLAVSRNLDAILPGKRAGIAKLLAEQMDKSMIDAAQRSGISGLVDQVRVANTMTREMHRVFEQNLITKIMESKNPEVIASYLRTGGLQELRDLNALLSDPQRRVVQSQILKDSMMRSTENGAKPMEPQKLAKDIHDLGEERGRLIFGKNYDSIRQVADLMTKIKSSSAGGGASALHNWAYLSAAPTAGMAVATGHPGTAAAVAATTGAETVFMRKLAKAMTNPAKSARMVHYLRLGARGAPYAAYGFSKLIEDNEPEQEKGK